MPEDWRITIEVEEEEHARGLLERLGAELSGEARELARELEERRLVVSRDGERVFVYASSRDEAERAQAVVQRGAPGARDRGADEPDRALARRRGALGR